MADIGPRDELYMIDPQGKLEKMDPGTHHLEHLMSYYPDEEDYNEDFWDTVFEGGWIRIELRENHRGGWDLALNGNNLYRMKAVIRDKFLDRLKRGENKVHIEEWTGSGFNPTHIFYLPAQKDELFDFVFEKLKAKFIYETLDFERGLDPIKSMNIGREELIKKIDWELNLLDQPKDEVRIEDFISNYRGFPILIYNLGDSWQATSIMDHTGITLAPQVALNAMKRRINTFLKKADQKFVDKWFPGYVKEDLNFERGIDPKDAMGIGDPILRLVQKSITPGFFSRKKKDVEASIEDLMNEILKHPAWDGDLNSITHVDLEKWSDGTFIIEIEHPWSWGSRGKEIKKVLRYMGIKPIGNIDTFTRGDYKYYQIPIEPLPIKESANFERGLDPKEAIGIGQEELNRKRSEEVGDIAKVPAGKYRVFLSGFSGRSKYRTVKDMGEDILVSDQWAEKNDIGFEVFPKELEERNKKWKKRNPGSSAYFFIDPEERIGIKESQNFERGLDPKVSMDVGIEARKRRLDKETDWGFEFSPTFHLKTFDIIEYEGFLIKIVRVMGSDGIAYYATLNNTGEPYNNTPPLYNTPEEALDWEQKYIDQYNMGL